MTVVDRTKAERAFGRRALFWGAPAAVVLCGATRATAAPPEPTRTVVVKKEAAAPAHAEPERRSDFIYFEAETGPQYVGLETLSVKRDVVPIASHREDIGAFVGAAAGAKIVFLA